MSSRFLSRAFLICFTLIILVFIALTFLSFNNHIVMATSKDTFLSSAHKYVFEKGYLGRGFAISKNNRDGILLHATWPSLDPLFDDEGRSTAHNDNSHVLIILIERASPLNRANKQYSNYVSLATGLSRAPDQYGLRVLLSDNLVSRDVLSSDNNGVVETFIQCKPAVAKSPYECDMHFSRDDISINVGISKILLPEWSHIRAAVQSWVSKHSVE